MLHVSPAPHSTFDPLSKVLWGAGETYNIVLLAAFGWGGRYIDRNIFRFIFPEYTETELWSHSRLKIIIKSNVYIRVKVS